MGKPDPGGHWSSPTFRMKIPFLPSDRTRLGFLKGQSE